MPSGGSGGSNSESRRIFSTSAAWRLPRVTHSLVRPPTSTLTQRTVSNACQAARRGKTAARGSRLLLQRPVQQERQRRHEHVRPECPLGPIVLVMVDRPHLQQSLQVGKSAFHLVELFVGRHRLRQRRARLPDETTRPWSK